MKRLASVWRPLVGGVIWSVVVVWRGPSLFETNWATALLLLSPLVLVPLGLRLALRIDPKGSGARLLRWALHLQPPTALSLVIAFTLPAGWLAAVFSLPWLATTAVISLAGLVRIWQRGSVRPEALCLDAGLVYLVIGGGWAVMAAWGLRPLDFESVIVLLTAIHFHHAGFVLPLLTGLAGKHLGGIPARTAALGVMGGVPLVAVGITATRLGFGPWFECLAACTTALAGLIVAWLHLRLARQRTWSRAVRSLWCVAALSLTGSMVLAALYGCRFFAPVAWLDIPWMRALHGTTNALGFGLAGMIGWSLANWEIKQSSAGYPDKSPYSLSPDLEALWPLPAKPAAR